MMVYRLYPIALESDIWLCKKQSLSVFWQV